MDIKNQNFKSMAQYYNMSGVTFQKNIKSIRTELDKIGGKKKGERYSKLSPAQVKRIIQHMGEA